MTLDEHLTGTVVAGQTAVAHVAYHMSDALLLQPATDQEALYNTPIGPVASTWSNNRRPNLANRVPTVTSLSLNESNGDGIEDIYDKDRTCAVLTGSRALLNMIPTMFNLVSKNTPVVFHVATQNVMEDLSIRSDMTDVTAVRDTGFAILASGTVQEMHDLAVIAHLAASSCSTPLVHFFDGARSAFEYANVKLANRYDLARLKTLVDDNVAPSAAHADVSLASHVDSIMEQASQVLGHRYKLFEYSGPADAELLIVTLGPFTSVAEEAARYSRTHDKSKVGVLNVRLLRPWSTSAFLASLPRTTRRVCVLDQTGIAGKGPLFLDVATAFHSDAQWVTPLLLGGRVGVDTSGFTPAMARVVINNLVSASPVTNFSVGVEGLSGETFLPAKAELAVRTVSSLIEQVVFWHMDDAHVSTQPQQAGVVATLAADILGPRLGLHVQQYDVTDPKQNIGKVRRSELRVGPMDIIAEYPIQDADCVVVDNPSLLLLPQYKIVDTVKTGGKLVLNTPWTTQEELAHELPNPVKRALAQRGVKIYTVDASAIAEKVGLSDQIAVPWIMQAILLAMSDKVAYKQAFHHFKTIMKRNVTLDTDNLFDELEEASLTTNKLHAVEYLAEQWKNAPFHTYNVLAGGSGEATLVPSLLLASAADNNGPEIAPETSNTKAVEGELSKSYEQLLDQLFGERLAKANTNTSDSKAEKPTHASLESCYGNYIAKLQARNRLVDHVDKVLNDRAVSMSSFLRAALGTWYANKDSAVACQKAVDEIMQYLPNEAHNNDNLRQIMTQRALLPKVSEWIIGGERWAYDVQSSGIHHIISSGEDVNVLILDSENFVTNQLSLEQHHKKKDIGLYAMSYGDAYVASISVNSSHTQALRALAEADAFKGPSIILAHAPEATNVPEAIQFSIDAVENGKWPLYRWNPELDTEDTAGEPFALDSKKLKSELQEFLKREHQLSLMANEAAKVSSSLQHSVEYDIAKQEKLMKSEMDQRKLNNEFSNLTTGLNPDLNLLVLYGSDGGNGASVAEMLAKKAEVSGCGEVRVMEANEFKYEELSEEKTVFFVLSTAGQGEDCANAKNLCGDIRASKSRLDGVKFAVFGLGDSHYWGEGSDDSAKYFCKPAREVDEKLATLGAVRLVDAGLGDDQNDDGFDGALGDWEDKLWKALEVTLADMGNVGGAPEIIDDDIKIKSNFLRGMLDEGLADLSTGKLLPEDTKLTKFHGIYQQDLRTVREELDAKGLERAYSFMIRIGVPGGVATSEQYLAMDDLCNQYANGILKLTTRQAYQVHGVLKRNLKSTMKGINQACMDTLAACGDVNRNVIGNPHSRNSLAHADVLKLANDLNIHLKPKTSAYHEIWLDKKPVAGHIDSEPLYGETYLPRKFKIAIAVPPLNDTDVFAHCCGFIAIVENGKLLGYNCTIGGGMGTTHGNKATYPRLADVMGFCTPDQAVTVAEKVMLVQRDHGNRENRKHARLKYTLEDHGMDWYRAEVERLAGFKLEKARPFKFNTNADPYGWKQGIDGLWSYTMFVENGYLKDTEQYKIKTALREIAEFHTGGEISLTATQNLILGAITSERKPKIEALLQKWNIDNGRYSAMRLHSMACVALPTCALAMAESQTYLPSLITKIEETLDDCGLRHNAITIRMTGCPNGCARPYLAEIAFVGKAPGIYNLYLGAGFAGNRINKMYREGVNEEQILEILTPMLRRYAAEKHDNEHFGDWVIRAGIIEPTLHGRCFWSHGKENDLTTPSGTNQIYW